MLGRLKKIFSAFSDSVLEETAFKFFLISIFVMNIFDACFTLLWVDARLAIELNPLMNWLIEQSPGAFLFIKIFLVTLALMLIFKNRHKLISRALIVPVFAVYAWVSMIHINAIIFFS